MNIAQLDLLIHLNEYENVSRVAKELGISQPAVTMKIKMLEQELGIPLINRNGKNISMTPAGKEFKEYAQRSLSVIMEGFNIIAMNEDNFNKNLSILGTPTISSYFLPKLIGGFIHSHPRNILLQTSSTKDILKMILDEVACVGFISGSLVHTEIVSIPIYEYPICLVASPEHPLTQKSNLNIIDLKDEIFSINRKNSNLYNMINNLFREHCTEFNIDMDLDSAESVKRMVISGNGLAFLPWIVVEKELETKSLVELPLKLSRPLKRDISLIFNKTILKHPLIGEFLREIFITSKKMYPLNKIT